MQNRHISSQIYITIVENVKMSLCVGMAQTHAHICTQIVCSIEDAVYGEYCFAKGVTQRHHYKAT